MPIQILRLIDTVFNLNRWYHAHTDIKAYRYRAKPYHYMMLIYKLMYTKTGIVQYNYMYKMI